MKRSPVILVAQYVLLDSKILLNSFKKYGKKCCGVWRYTKMFRIELPQRKTSGLGYMQVKLVKDILKKEYTAHSAC